LWDEGDVGRKVRCLSFSCALILSNLVFMHRVVSIISSRGFVRWKGRIVVGSVIIVIVGMESKKQEARSKKKERHQKGAAGSESRVRAKEQCICAQQNIGTVPGHGK